MNTAGLVVNDTIIHDNLSNKSHRRRCSLATSNLTGDDTVQSIDQEKSNDQKKGYIRKLSIANDDSAEPNFLFRIADKN